MDDTLRPTFYHQMSALVRLGMRAYRPYLPQIGLLTSLSFLGGLLEGIGINALIPLLTFVLNLHDPAVDTISLLIRALFASVHVPFVPRYLLAFIVILFIGKGFISLLLSYIQIRITTEYERKTRARLFGMVLRASWPYLLRQKLGNLETLLMVDAPISTSLLLKLSAMITLATSLLMYLVVAFSISGLITAATFLLGVLILLFLRPLIGCVHLLSRERATIYRDTVHHVSEHVSGLKTVKALNVAEAAIEKGNALFESIKTQARRIQALQQIAAQAIPPIGVLYIAGILALALKTPFISLAALPAMLYLIYRIMSYIQQMQNNVHAISEYIPHLERVVLHEESAAGTQEVATGTQPFNFARDLSFKNISFAYESGRDVLKHLNFSVKKGEMLGIVGPSGAGKTTCVDLMLRLLPPTAGRIELDGVDCKEIALPEWRTKIAYVSQELFVTHDTVRNNIRFYDETITDEEVWKAAHGAHIDGFIRSLPQGLDTLLGDRGITVSAGERQRIVIARALARKPEILILDEATSALDNESEAHIRRAIKELKGRVTIIAIAHRLSTIMDSDRLLVLDEGRIAEEGSPKELLANTDSYFYRVSTINQ